MSINVGNIFSALSLSEYMLSSLPADADPQLKNPFDTVALLAHACMLVVGFRLEGLGEDHRIEVKSEGTAVQPLPREWNASSTYDYAFRYAHEQSSLKYLVKVSRLGGKAVVNGMAIDDDKVHTMDFPIKEFLSSSPFPYTAQPSNDKGQKARALENLFISPGRITDLGSLLKVQIIQKLAPGLYKEGYEESAHAASQNEDRDRRVQPVPNREDQTTPVNDPLHGGRLPPNAEPRPYDDPLAAAPRRPFPPGDFPPPGFEDEYEINRPPGRGGLGEGRRPLNIGERDLYPPGLGPHDPLRGGGFGPGGVGGGGMHPTFDDPLFGGGGGGTGGYDGRAPPGARYDPIGPGDGPPNLRGGRGFPGGGGFGGGRPQNPFGGFGGGDFI